MTTIATATSPRIFDTSALAGRAAIVTGASKGIGLAIARGLTAAGAGVMLSSRSRENLDEAVASIEGDVAAFPANAGDPAQAESCIAATMVQFGRVDIVVNNAAVNPVTGNLLDTDQQAFDKIVKVNMAGPLAWTSAAVDAWMASNGGSVINIASVGGLRHEKSLGAYNTSKAALIHMTRVLATELGPKTRVNAIAPGLVRTDFAKSLWSRHEDRVARRLPLERIGEPDDIAGAAVFLASDASRWMTGQVLAVDGGALVG